MLSFFTLTPGADSLPYRAEDLAVSVPGFEIIERSDSRRSAVKIKWVSSSRLHIRELMPTVHFLGRIIPKGIDLTFSNLPQANCDSAENDLHVEIAFHIAASHVDIECSVNRFAQGDLESIHKIALDLTKALVNLYDFATGIGHSVIFEAFIDPSGSRSILCPMDMRLAPLCTAFTIKPGVGNTSFNEVLNIVLREPPLFMALNELVEAVTQSHVAPVNCARAVERLRHLVAPGIERKESWTHFRNSLQIGRDYIEFVTTHSTGVRHGDPQFIRGEITTEVTRRAWIVMNRFLEFRKRGNRPLPESEFPLLA